MKHPPYLNEAEKVIRYQDQQMATASDLDKIQGSSRFQASKLDALYDNYYDFAKTSNISDFKIMKTVDKCLVKNLKTWRRE